MTWFRCTDRAKGCKGCIGFKWYNLSLILIPIIQVLTFMFKDKYNFIYVPIVFGICALILFANFPAIVVSLHSRPIYYDDLVIKDYSDEENGGFYDDAFRRKYQNIFKTIIIISSSLMVAGTVELWYYRNHIFSTTNTTRHDRFMNILIVISVLGGLFRIYYSAIMFIGSFVMFILKQLKKREQRLLQLNNQDIIMYNLTNDGITLNMDDTGIGITADNAGGVGRLRQSRSLEHMADHELSLKPSIMCDIFN